MSARSWSWLARGGARAGGFIQHVVVMVGVSALTGVLVAGLALPFAGLTGLGTRSVANGLEALPDPLSQQPLPQTTTVLTRSGKPLAYFYKEDRHDVPLSRIAPIMQRAVVAIEDYRFYQHGAIDLKGTLRAFITNAANSGVVQGGSSITQQLVKMTLLEQAKTKRQRLEATADTYERKFRELRYALKMEDSHTKREILNRYLNIAYFGDGVYGIQEAARHYFSVNAANLNLKQAALLAGLVKNPTGYDPTTQPQAAIDRRNTVLARMAQLGMVDESVANRLERRPLGLKVSTKPNGCVSTAAPFFCDYLRRYLTSDPALGKTPAAREHLLETGGLTIRSTIDLRFQRAADRAVRKHVYPTDRALGALAMVKPGTGEVKAIAQSRPMGNRVKKGQTYLDYVVPPGQGGSGGFQAGSTFKFFTLTTALKEGLPTTTSFNSPPTIVMPQGSYRDCEGHYPATWRVSNSTDSGYMDMYSGTQESVNTYFAQLEKKVGLCKIVKTARKLGIVVPKSDEVGPFTLGVTSVSPLQMAAAYATAASRGIYCPPHPVTSILDRYGNAIKLSPVTCRRVMPKAVADTINDILRGVQSPTGFGAALMLNQQSAAKTGTTSSNKSVWYMGYTPNLVTAAMIAGANRAGHPITLVDKRVGPTYVTGDVAFGSTLAGPMWYDAMKVIQQWLPNKRFHAPNPRVVEGQPVTVPALGGQSPSHAASELRQLGLDPVISSTVDSSYPAGTVAYTDPGAYAPTTSGSTVYIYISDGTPYVPPPPPSPSPQPNPQPKPQPKPNPSPSPTPSPSPSPTGGGGGNGGGNGHGHGHGPGPKP